MAGSIKTNSVQLGDSATATQNFVWQTNVDGTAKLARGNVGATTQDILTVDANGVVAIASGIKFPATQVPSTDVNTLDDYEEGTWTPAFMLGVPGTSSFTYTIAAGTYTKVGKQVSISFHITLSGFSLGTGSGALFISGIPFPANSSASWFAGTIGYAVGFVTSWPNGCIIPASGNAINLYFLSPTGNSGVIAGVNASSGIDLYGSVVYQTTA